jgi:hypothetical protein
VKEVEALFRIDKAVDIATRLGWIGGDHHKMYVLDQMVRTLTGCPIVTKTGIDCQGQAYTYQDHGESAEYKAFREKVGSNWDEGVAP